LAFRLVITIKQRVCLIFHALQKRFLCWVKPPTTSIVLGTLTDLLRGKSELIAENALLRQQLTILHRQIKRPVYKKTDRLLLVLLARMVRTWKQALYLLQPETLLRWHRELFRVVWKRKSKASSSKPKLTPETISLIKEMAANNRMWGAERIRGELLKLDMRRSQTNHPEVYEAEIWACDFLSVTDLFFRPLFAFFIIELKSRKIIHVNVTRSPTDPWVAQQLREATPYGQTPTYLIRDTDRKFGQLFARVAATSGIKVLRTPYRTPRANAVCERFLLSVRRECLDHFLILREQQLHRLLKTYVRYFNQARPHQGIGQRIPDPPVLSALLPNQPNRVISIPVLGGLHHTYQRAA
jgi:putative transposase